MNEEEKKAIEFIQEVIDFLGDDDFTIYTTDKNKLLTILGLIENQQKVKEKNKEAREYMYDLLNADIPNVGTDDINNLLSILEEK